MDKIKFSDLGLFLQLSIIGGFMIFVIFILSVFVGVVETIVIGAY